MVVSVQLSVNTAYSVGPVEAGAPGRVLPGDAEHAQGCVLLT